VGKKRFQREHSNSLWQADFELCRDDWWMIRFQDEYLLLALAARLFSEFLCKGSASLVAFITATGVIWGKRLGNCGLFISAGLRCR